MAVHFLKHYKNMQCCVCKKATGQLYQEISTGLIYCSFIEGQKRERGDEDNKLEEFKLAIQGFQEARGVDKKTFEANVEKAFDIIKDAVENYNINVLEYAFSIGFLKQHKDKFTDDSIFFGSLFKNLKSLKFFLDKQIFNVNDTKASFLHNALEWSDNQFEIVKFLIDEGANVNIVVDNDFGKETPLEFIARYGKFDLIKLLIDNGAVITYIVIWNAFESLQDMIEEQLEDDLLLEALNENAMRDILNGDGLPRSLKFILNNIPPNLDLLEIDTNKRLTSLFEMLDLPILRTLFIATIFKHYRMRQLITRQGVTQIPRDISRKIIAEKLRNTLCKELTRTTKAKSHLITLAIFLGVPDDIANSWNAFSKDKLCSYVSSIIAIGAIWDNDKFSKERVTLRAMKERQRSEVMDAVTKFKRGVEYTLALDTEGKTLDEVMQEADALFD